MVIPTFQWSGNTNQVKIFSVLWMSSVLFEVIEFKTIYVVNVKKKDLKLS